MRSSTLVAPIASGGVVDTAARIAAEKLHERLRQPIVVENRPGAGSVIGNETVTRRQDGKGLPSWQQVCSPWSAMRLT